MVANINYIPAEAKALSHEGASALVGSFSSAGTQTHGQISAPSISDLYTVHDQAVQAFPTLSIQVIVHVVLQPQSQYIGLRSSAWGDWSRA